MTYLLLGLGILVLGLALVSGFQRASPSTLAKWIRGIAACVALAVGVYLIVSGRIFQAVAVLAAAGLLFAQLRRAWPALGGRAAPGRGGATSEVETAFLRASLDHASGAVTGTVLQGAFAGHELASLGEADLVALYLECLREDESSARLVEAFLDRGAYAATWRDRLGERTPGGAAAGRAGPMTPEEARRILGVAADAAPAAIRAAHHRLMMANHPDHGGSAYLAAKINEARDCLLSA